MPRLSRLTAAAVLVVASPLVAAPGDELSVLIPTPDGYNHAGWSVAIDGGYSLVGAPADRGGNGINYPPLLYVYDTATSELLWSLEEPASILDPDDPDAITLFGTSVAVSGDQAFVGADYVRRDGSNQIGAVVQFDLLTGESIRVYSPTGPFPRWFGQAVAVSGSLLAVGAPQEDVISAIGPPLKGAAYIFDTTTGELLHRCVPTRAGTRGMGEAIAISQTRLLVGARSTPGAAGIFSGRAFLFDVATGGLVATLEPSDLQRESSFGVSVALNDDFAFVGASGSAEPDGLGAVYVFDVRTGVQVEKISGAGMGGQFFGFTLAADGDSLAIYADGKVDLYQYPSLFRWGRAAVQSYPGTVASQPIALDNGRLIGGASRLRIDGELRGGAFIFEAPGPKTRCPGDVDDSGAIDLADLNMLLGEFGQPVTPGTGGDFDESGVVDLADLNIVLGLFGAQCP